LSSSAVVDVVLLIASVAFVTSAAVDAIFAAYVCSRYLAENFLRSCRVADIERRLMQFLEVFERQLEL